MDGCRWPGQGRGWGAAASLQTPESTRPAAAATAGARGRAGTTDELTWLRLHFCQIVQALVQGHVQKMRLPGPETP